MKRLVCRFYGRTKGVIGIFEWFLDVYINAEDEAGVRAALYETHEHITQLSIEEVAKGER